MSALATIHMFWHGPPPSRLERLCMASFVANGHPLHLHCYRPPEGLPDGVVLRDGRETLPEQRLFLGAGGSLALFADQFRCALLNREGGIWADTDVVCLKPLRYPSPLVFGLESDGRVNNAVLGLEPGHRILRELLATFDDPCRAWPFDTARDRRRKLLRRLRPGDRRRALKWGELGPHGVSRWLAHLGLMDQALPFWHFYPVHWSNWRAVFDESLADNVELVANSRTLHLWNEMLRRHHVDKDRPFPARSLFEQLCRRFGVE